MLTLRALAQSLGLSITTVSRALDGYNDVSPVTRQRVKEAALAAGYRPNPVARRLRKGTSETIALVMPTEPGRFYDAAFVELLSILGELLARRQLDLMLLAARPGPDELSVYRRLVEGRRADACIVVRTRRDDQRVRYLQQHNFPFLCMGRTESPKAYAYVDGDGTEAFRVATERMIAQGRRRIAHLTAPASLNYAGIRAAGWRAALQEADLPTDMINECNADEEGGYAVATRLLQGSVKPDAILAATDRIAIGALRAIQELGLVVGQDIAVIGHDNVPAASFASPPLTTMELPMREVGSSMVEKIVALAGGAKAVELTELFPLRHILRASSSEVEA